MFPSMVVLPEKRSVGLTVMGVEVTTTTRDRHDRLRRPDGFGGPVAVSGTSKL